eukprot:CAMPEP_0194095142 /NCGR_PEP_ID=MMETSP0149-20130528/56674_1 /TAXON_ID=122233 /ORGANISM="Chaetoceros debilis, Strain MM31A-1" /LENGTH=509 /DNA_ID=CAMNT_0038781079 /DNA_START=35 /DNA_END=1564 /DNA_ORIENTATION=+
MKLTSISLVSLLLSTAAAKQHAPNKLRRAEDQEYYVAVEEEEVQETNATSYTTTYYEELEEAVEEAVEDTSSYSSAFGSDDAYDLSEYFFDMSKFSLKVHSCASITGLNIDEYSNSGSQSEDEDGGDNEWVNKTSTVVNYRLCPSDTCNSDGWSGCRNVYGNYMVSVEKYLESKMQYKEEASEQMCDKCNWCDWAYSNLGYECDIYEECQSFSCPEDSAEGEEGDDGEEEQEREEENEYQQFAECTAVDIYVEEEADGADYYGRRKLEEEAEDNQVYLQIYCDGGTTLKIGIYSDEDCSEFIGDQYDMAEITGLNITESDLEDELTTECVSCSEKESKYYIPEYDGSGSGSGDGGNEEEISETCQQMYEDSIKCNEYIPYNYTAYYDEAEEWEETMNNVTCAFIESVQQETEETVVASNSYGDDDDDGDGDVDGDGDGEGDGEGEGDGPTSFYTTMNNKRTSINGGNFYVAGVVVALVGAAIVVIRQKNTKTIKGQDLNSAFVDGGVSA